jgi:hypothetical protein
MRHHSIHNELTSIEDELEYQFIARRERIRRHYRRIDATMNPRCAEELDTLLDSRINY